MNLNKKIWTLSLVISTLLIAPTSHAKGRDFSKQNPPIKATEPGTDESSTGNSSNYLWDNQTPDAGQPDARVSKVKCDEHTDCCIGYVKNQQTGRTIPVRCMANSAGGCPSAGDCHSEYQKQLSALDLARIHKVNECDKLTNEKQCAPGSEIMASDQCETHVNVQREARSCGIEANKEAANCTKAWIKQSGASRDGFLYGGVLQGGPINGSPFTCNSCDAIKNQEKKDDCNDAYRSNIRKFTEASQNAFDVNKPESIAHCIYVKPSPNTANADNTKRCDSLCDSTFRYSDALKKDCTDYSHAILGRFKGVYRNGKFNADRLNVLSEVDENQYQEREFWIKYHVANQNSLLGLFKDRKGQDGLGQSVELYFSQEAKRLKPVILDKNGKLSFAGWEMVLRCNALSKDLKLEGKGRKSCEETILAAVKNK